MNSGAFGENFPYSNFHDLNMDWIIKIAKDFLDQYTHIQEIIEQGKEDIETLTESGIEQIGDLTADSLQDLENKKDALEALLQEWYNTHSEDIANELADALADLNEWYTTHQNYLDDTLTQKILAFNNAADAKAAQTIASIPADYSTLSDEVSSLQSETVNILEYEGNIPNISCEVSTSFYINKNDGVLYSYSSAIYAATKEYIPVIPNGAYKLNAQGSGSAGYAWYDKDKTYISGGVDAADILVAPQNAYYFRFSNYNENGTHTGIMFYFYGAMINKTLYVNVANNNVYYYTPELINGFINKTSGLYFPYGDGIYKATRDFIEISADYIYYLSAYENGSSGYAFYDEDFIYISGGNSPTYLDIPSNAKYLRFTSIDNDRNHNIFLLIQNKISSTIDFDEILGYAGEITFTPTLDTTSYIDKNTGIKHAYGAGVYACTDYIRVNKSLLLSTTITGQGTAGYAFYSKEKIYISGGNNTGSIEIPNNAYYIRLTDYNTDGIHTGKTITFKTKFYDKFITSNGNITIQCTGDSVTEGMATDGAHTAEYGKSPYPAQLTTLLVDNGYSNVTVTNCGHGGERTPEISARIGAFACYFTEDVVVPGDGSDVSLGTATITDGLVTGTKLKIAYPYSNTDYCVFFTQDSWDTNPVSINGESYVLSILNNTNYIRKATPDGENTTIKAGTFFFTNDNRNPTVNIVYGGINDNIALTMERWLNTMDACRMANGGKGIILGPTHALWDYRWQDVTGTSAEKYQKYKTASYNKFGVHFIDLYQLFFENAMAYCLEAGYFSDKTPEEIASMEALLNAHVIPKEFSYDGNHQGDVHLSREGYYVIARLIFDRLKNLKYI